MTVNGESRTGTAAGAGTMCLLAVLLAYVMVYIAPLGVRPLAIPDETRYAEIPREMLDTGDFVVPHLDGLRYFEKTPLGYWLGAASLAVFGENEFAVRLPSALSAGLSAVLIFLLVAKYGGGRRTAILAAASFLTCLEVFGVGVFSVLDSLVSMILTGVLAAFFGACQAETARRRNLLLVICGLLCGLAFLTKGFLAFAVPVLTAVPFLLWQKRWRDMFVLPWIPFAVAVLVSLPWGVAIHLRDGDFWRYFFWVEHIQRFTAANAQHKQPFLFFVPVLFAGALPWAMLLPAVVAGLRKRGLRDPLIRFALCWLVLPFLFFSMSKGKLGTYILPCFPPLMILTALGLREYFEGGGRKAFTVGALCSAGFAALLAIVPMVVPLSHLPGLGVYERADAYGWILSSAFAVWAGVSVLAALARAPVRRLALFFAAPLFVMFIIHFIAKGFDATNAPGEFLARHEAEIQPGTLVISDGYMAPAVCWYYKRSDVGVFGWFGELGYGLDRDETRHRRFDPGSFGELVAGNAGRERVVLILDAERYEEFKPLLPVPVSEQSDSGFVFARY